MKRRPSIEVEETEDESDNYRTSVPPRNPWHILEAADGSDNAIEEDPAPGGLKRVMKPNWVHSFIIAWDTKLTISAIEQLSKDWTSPIYVFFRTLPHIDYVEGCCIHIFECAAGKCQGKNGRDIRRYLDKGNAKSTSGLHQHAMKCWGCWSSEGSG